MQHPQRSGKLRGSQTARGDSSRALSESRKDMAEAKSTVQVLRPMGISSASSTLFDRSSTDYTCGLKDLIELMFKGYSQW